MRDSSFKSVWFGAALLVGVSFLSPSADAATFRLQAFSGRPSVSAGTHALNSATVLAGWTISDGRTVIRDSTASGVGTWIIPIPVDATNRTWTIQAYQTLGSQTRMCSFTSGGAFSGCSGNLTGSTTATATVFVPTDGTAYAQSFMTGGGIAGSPQLFGVKVF